MIKYHLGSVTALINQSGDIVDDGSRVINIDNPVSIPMLQQNITYTAFQKAENISENNLHLHFTYGPDYARKISMLTDNQNNTLRKIIYAGNYEKIMSGNNIYEVKYIAGGDGLAAIAVKQNAGREWIYYAHTDHLGSIVGIYDNGGQKIYAQSFDAWGRERNPNDWTYTANPNTKPQWLIRGFTGHEHHREFGLINMNGRVYDPLIARMLSPDNFVQNASGTQSFNRYSYCINNPLKFTDPSGNFLGTIFTSLWDFSATIFTKGVIDPWNTKANRRAAWSNFDPTAQWSKTNKAWRIDIGLFKTDPNRTFAGRSWELISRFTWQLPQTTIGYTYTHGRNVSGRVERVEYFHGSTIAVKNPGQGKYASNSVTLGNYEQF
ncbi:MAG: RHS repeat-associated core domain-containing protein [Bacteroidota bacterium]